MNPVSEALNGANINDFSELTNNTSPTVNRANTAAGQIANQMVNKGALPIKKRPVLTSFTDQLPTGQRPVLNSSNNRSIKTAIPDNRLPLSKRSVSSVEINSQVYSLKEFKLIYEKVASTVPASNKRIKSLINSNSFYSRSIMTSAAIRQATMRYVYVRTQEMGISMMDKDKSEFKALIVSCWKELARNGT